MKPESRTPSGVDLIYRNVLDNVASGVLSLDTGGVITSFNVAAGEICGLTGETVVGRRFGEIFMHLEGLDAFVDTIFDAIQDTSTVHQRVIEVTLDGKVRTLSVSTTYLKEDHEGKTVRIGVVVIFSDITEIRELREKELHLAREIEAKHGELLKAYVELEETNRKLGMAAKRIRIVRTVSVLGVLGLFLALGIFFWDAVPRFILPGGDPAANQQAPVPQEFRAIVVEPRRITSSVTMLGKLAPRREVEVVSPIEGKVGQVYVHPGQQVVEGQRLVDMDVAEMRIEHREAQVAFIKARERVEELEAWSEHVDVSRARRAVSKSRIALESRKNRLEETAFLLGRGIIPASEHEAAQREFRNQELDLQSAERDLEAILVKGKAELEVARLELDNARARLDGIKVTISRSTVTAPAGGVILYSQDQDGEGTASSRQDETLAAGTYVERGDLLLTIGDLAGLTIIGYVDEVDVTRIRPGHAARITGDAFPGIVLQGAVEQVSSQALTSSRERSLPHFEIAAVVESLTPAQQRLLRLGMSARIEVVVYENKQALLVPIEAVSVRDGRHSVQVRDRGTGEVRRVSVTAGMTTLNAVEITDGIAAGDEILIGGGAP